MSSLFGNTTEFLQLKYQSGFGANPVQAGKAVLQASTRISVNAPSVTLGDTENTMQINYDTDSITLTANKYIMINAPEIFLCGRVQNLDRIVIQDQYTFFEPPPINQVWFNNPFDNI